MKISLTGKFGKKSYIKKCNSKTILILNEKHYCGLLGFNPMLGDTCSACKIKEALYSTMKKTNVS